MQQFLTRALTIIVTVLAVPWLHSPASATGTTCQVTDPLTGNCTVWIEVPGSSASDTPVDQSGPNDTGSGAACYWDGTDQGIHHPPPGPVPCSSSLYGYWSNTHRCYVEAADPQPPAGDRNWQGHQPGDGAVYACFQPQTAMLAYFWAQNPPASSGAGPTPREVAEVAVRRMGLRAIGIGIAPKPGPDSIGLVGMPVWMWAKAPTANSLGPISASASAGGITITATAKVLHVTWDMGDGASVVCDTAGTPYRPAFGRTDSPDCGHTYTKTSGGLPGDAYTVTATSSWVITWSGAGQTGTIRLGGLTRSTQIRIGEAQVLVN